MLRARLLFALLLLASLKAAADTVDLRLISATAGAAPPKGFSTIDVKFADLTRAPATDLTITVTIPAGVTYAGSSFGAPNLNMNCTEPPLGSAGTLVCKLSSMPTSWFVNQVVPSTLELLAQVDATTVPGTVITFPVTMTSSNAVQPSQSGSASMTVIAPADLALSATAPSELTAGDGLVTKVILINNGPGDALGVNFGVLQTGGADVQQIAGPPGWNCAGAGCHADTFATGGRATFVVTSLVPGAFEAPSVTQRFSADSVSETDYRNNMVLETTAIDPAPQTTLKAAITVTPEHFYAGDIVTYTATTTNTGHATAYKVAMGLAYNGNLVLSTDCGTGSVISCTFPALAAGATQTITGTVRIVGLPGSQVTESAFTHAFNAAADNASLSTTLNPAPPPLRRRAARH